MICSYIRKLRAIGFGGAIAYAKKLLHERKLTHYLLNNAALYPTPAPERGLTLVADWTASCSLSKVMRDFAFSLKDAGIPFQTFDSGDGKGPVSAEELKPILTPKTEFRYARFSHIVEMFTGPAPKLPGHLRATIGFAEFAEGFLTAHPPMRTRDHIIAMSDFNYEIFKHEYGNNARVTKILYPFRRPQALPLTRTDMRFTVFFNFDFDSSFVRKNPDGVIRAFAKAFPNQTDVRLVFKTMNAKHHPEALAKLNALAEELGIANKFEVLTAFLPQDELYALTANCDVYISLHRGEGFGLGIAEAMACSKAVISTDYSAPTEFVNADNAIPVPYKLVDFSKIIDHASYTEVKSFADADINFAANALRELYDHPEKRQALGQKAHDFIANHFSITEFRKSVNEFLDCRE